MKLVDNQPARLGGIKTGLRVPDDTHDGGQLTLDDELEQLNETSD
ncbi:hypothetical protein [Mycobacterium sp. 155]|nr:hypothetical protein [Mycobacterium sp. 155]